MGKEFKMIIRKDDTSMFVFTQSLSNGQGEGQFLERSTADFFLKLIHNFP